MSQDAEFIAETKAPNSNIPEEFVFVLNGQKYVAMPIDPTQELSFDLELGLQPVAEHLLQKDFMMAMDTWEPDVAAWMPRSDIVTRLILLRRTGFGISCHLNVHIGNGEPCELPSAATSVREIRDWLGTYETGRNIASRLGMQDEDGFALCKRWLEVFTEPLQQWEALQS